MSTEEIAGLSSLGTPALSSGHPAIYANTDNGSCSERSPNSISCSKTKWRRPSRDLRSRFSSIPRTTEQIKVLSHARSGGTSQSYSLCLPAPTQIISQLGTPLGPRSKGQHLVGSPGKGFHLQGSREARQDTQTCMDYCGDPQILAPQALGSWKRGVDQHFVFASPDLNLSGQALLPHMDFTL